MGEWLRLESGGMLLWTQSWNFGFHKRQPLKEDSAPWSHL